MSFATRIAQEFNNVRSHISGITAYHLLDGNLSLSNEVITTGFRILTWTGNGGAQPLNLDMDIQSQWGNDASETFGYLIKIKSRSVSGDWTYVDSIRGSTKYIASNTTAVEGTDANMFTLNTVAGVTTLTLGSSTRTNVNGVTYVAEIYQTTHRISGTTNHNKPYTCHFNPAMGFSIDKMEGSGIAGHEIPHHLGRKLGLSHIKNLTAISDFISNGLENGLNLNNTGASSSGTLSGTSNNDTYTITLTVTSVNTSSNQYIMYGWANSYFDEANTLIGNYEIGVYQGTGAAGNKVTTKGKPAWIIIKRLDGIGDWYVFDNQRDTTNPNNAYLLPSGANAEQIGTTFGINILSDGFTCNDNNAVINASGGQYLYFGVYDNDSGSGKSKYPKASDTANVQVNNALIPLAKGIDANGVKNSIVVANETITGVTYTAGKNYLYKTDSGYGVKPYEPRYLSSELVRRFAGEQPDYFDVESNKWFNTDAGTDLIINGKFDVNTSGWTAGANTTLSVVNGTLKILNNTTYAGYAYTMFSTVIGKKYKLTLTLSVNNTSNPRFYLGTAGGSGDMLILQVALGITTIEFTAVSTTTYLTLDNTNAVAGNYTQWDEITSYLLDITPTTEITESRNYLDAIVHADANGQVVYVEELPKIEYKDSLQVNELNVLTGLNVNELNVLTDLNVLTGFNLNQNWQDVTGSRISNATYTNSTAKPILVCCSTASGAILNTLFVDSIPVSSSLGNNSVAYSTAYAIVPAGSTYKFGTTSIAISQWSELR